ncbi:hypothetical protein C0J52_19558 [Blattella germanica]|nr:hypothetical protein C0J52_19558 [Blattella germanica]
MFQMIDVKSGANYSSGFPVLGNPSVFICPPDPYTSQDLYNPVYEELSNGSGDRGDSDPDSEGAIPAPHSEDEFAEDELSLGGEGEGGSQPQSSLQGSTGNDLCRDLDSSDVDDHSRFLTGSRNFSLPPGYRSRTSRPPQHRTAPSRPRSLDRRRGWRGKGQPPQISPQSPARHQDCGEFHEGLLLDALLQLYPNVVANATTRSGRGSNLPPPHHHPPAVPSVAHRLPYLLQPAVPPPPHRNHVVNPYESVPVLNHLHQHHHGTTFRRGKAQSQDSSFGSDSGYSNNTSSRGRSSKDAHRLSAHSGDLVLS